MRGRSLVPAPATLKEEDRDNDVPLRSAHGRLALPVVDDNDDDDINDEPLPVRTHVQPSRQARRLTVRERPPAFEGPEFLLSARPLSAAGPAVSGALRFFFVFSCGPAPDEMLPPADPRSNNHRGFFLRGDWARAEGMKWGHPAWGASSHGLGTQPSSFLDGLFV